MSGLVSLTSVAQTLRIAMPYACAATAGIWAEKSGVIQIGLEGILLTTAFVSITVAHATGSALGGLIAALVAGLLVSVAHALLVERGRVHAVVSGIALNLMAAAGTRLALRGLYDSASNSPSIRGFDALVSGASGGAQLAQVLLDPITVLALLAVAVTPWMLARTRLGLHVRAAGENPVALSATGLDVVRIRAKALAISGVICALGGVHLAYDQHRFESGMSNGRGFIALAAIVVSGWRPGRAVAACLAFGALETIQISLQDHAQKSVFGDLVQLLPYVATLLVLAFAAGRSKAPQGLGRSAQ